MLKILVLEDNEDDLLLIEHELRAASLAFRSCRVDTLDAFVEQLDKFQPDIILADYSLPGLDGITALKAVMETKPDIPFVLVSGAIGQETAVEVLQRGARNYVSKSDLFRLAKVVRSAIDDAEKRRNQARIKKVALDLMEGDLKKEGLETWSGKTVGILLLEDNQSDVDLIQAQFRHEEATFDFTTVSSQREFETELIRLTPDLILADFSLPAYDGLSALRIRNQLRPDIPFIFVSGILGEEVAIESLKLGATDYVLKDKMARLVPVARSAWERAEEKARRIRIEEAFSEKQEITRSILESANDAILTVEESGIIRTTNPAFERVFGFRSEEAVGRMFNTLVPTFVVDFAKNHNHTTENRNGNTFAPLDHEEIHAVRKDGTLFPIDLSLNEINVRGRRLITAIISDITERRRLQDLLAKQIEDLEVVNQELKVARDDAVEAWQLQSQFVANISHEIRTPMSGIVGLADLLADSEIDESSRSLAKDIFGSAKRLMVVVNDLLDFSKLQSGKVNLDCIEFDVRTLVSNVTALVHAEVQIKKLDFSTWINPDIPERLSGDPARIQQALLNFVHNAVKFTADGSIRVKVDIVGETTSLFLKFIVEDEGIGIPQSAQKRIFEPFVQADGSTTRKFGGTGLGLSITKSLVHLMSGVIGLESLDGQGSVFWFTVPLKMSCDS